MSFTIIGIVNTGAAPDARLLIQKNIDGLNELIHARCTSSVHPEELVNECSCWGIQVRTETKLVTLTNIANLLNISENFMLFVL